MAGGKNSEPIIVAQIMGKWVGGGVESVIMNYYRHIDRSKVQFDFICDEDSTNIPYEEIEKLGGHVILCPPYQKLFKYMKFLENLFREKKYRIVHSNINTLSVFPLRAAKKAGVKVRIAHSHSASNPKEWKKNLLKNTLRPFSKRYATDYFACTEHAGRYQFGKKMLLRGDISIVTNAVEVGNYEFSMRDRGHIRKELGLSDDDYVIGNIGRLIPQKNQLFLVKVFRRIKNDNPNAKLLIVGEGPLREKIEKLSKKLGLEKDVIVENNHKDIGAYYSAMDVFAFPSIYEGLGMVVIEAQINGLLVIASNNVPADTKIAEAVKYLSLEDANEWVEEILNYRAMRNANGIDYEKMAKYNILNNADELVGLYAKLGSRNE